VQKINFFIFFSYNLPAGTLSSVLKINFFAKVVCKNFILQALFQSQHLFEKREGSGAGSGSVPLTNGFGSGSGRPKNMRIQIRILNTAFEDRDEISVKLFQLISEMKKLRKLC
jgi:hypothetical protein